MSVIDYLDPDEMVAEYAARQNDDESTVMGVTRDSLSFVRASDLLRCEWCNNGALHPSKVLAIKPENHAIMMCKRCMPKPDIPEEWL